MDRQLSEALEIARAGGIDSPNKMNSSEEYNRCILPELQTRTEVKMKEIEKRQREEENGDRAKKRMRGERAPNCQKRGVPGGFKPW